MLAFPIFHHAERLERRNYIVGVDRHLLTYIFDGELGAGRLAQVVEEDVFPIRTVRDQTEIAERFLRRTYLSFDASQEITWNKLRTNR